VRSEAWLVVAPVAARLPAEDRDWKPVPLEPATRLRRVQINPGPDETAIPEELRPVSSTVCLI